MFVTEEVDGLPVRLTEEELCAVAKERTAQNDASDHTPQSSAQHRYLPSQVPPKPDFSRLHPSLRADSLWDRLNPHGREVMTRAVGPALVQIFPESTLERLGHLLDALKTGDLRGDSVENLRNAIKQLRVFHSPDLRDLIGWRTVAMVTDKTDSQLQALGQAFPNFSNVVEFLRDRAALAHAGRGVLHWPPMLLNGAPGIGKTAFCRRLAAILSVELVYIDMASSQTGSPLSGSEEFWGNSKPGRIFRAVVLTESASPLVMLDELDKVHCDNRYDPLSPLYQLLEPVSAQAYHDLSVPDIVFDARWVLWIATSNSLDLLPPPLLSRLRAFEIRPPTIAEARQIAMNLHREIVQELELRDPPVLSGAFLDGIECRSVREFRRLIENGLARAVREGAREILPAHAVESAAGRRRIGF